MFYINRMGCECRHDANFIIDKPDGLDGYLMLFVKTRAEFRLGSEYTIVEPDTFIIYNKKSPQYYRACGGEYINDWAHFNCTGLLLDEQTIVFDTPVFIGESVDISQYFRLLADCYYRIDNPRTEEFLIKAMLSEVFSSSEKSRSDTDIPHYRELIELRRSIYARPDEEWNIEMMSRTINVSEPYLFNLYKKAFGVTCTADVINSRIEQAKHLLLCTDMTIEETAYACGYKNQVHFTRQFKQMIGEPPSKWRKTHNSSQTDLQ